MNYFAVYIMEAIWSSVNKTKVNFSFARGMAFIDHVVLKKKDVEYHGNVYVYSPWDRHATTLSGQFIFST